MQDFKATTSVAVQVDVSRREEEAAANLARATLDDATSSIEADCVKFDHYLVDVKKHNDVVNLRLSQHEHHVKERGKAAVESFLEKYSFIECHPWVLVLDAGQKQMEARVRPSQYKNMIAKFAQKALQGTHGTADSSGYWHIFDLTSFQSINDTQFADAIAGMVDAARGQPHLHAALFTMPMPTGKVNPASAFKHRRAIEDVIVRTGLDITYLTSWKFKENGHEGDRRPCAIWAMVATVTTSNFVFAKTNICLGQTTADAAALIRCKDMVAYRNVVEDTLPDKVTDMRGRRQTNDSDRLRQRGAAVTLAMVQDLIVGNALEAKNGIFIIEYFPTAAAEWSTCARNIATNTDPTALSGCPQKVYGLAFAESMTEKRCLEAQQGHELYEQWYKGDISLPGAGKVGAKSLMPDDLPPPPQQPLLKVAYIYEASSKIGHGPRLVLPSALKDKFAHRDETAEMWDTFVHAHHAKYGTIPESVRAAQEHATNAEPKAAVEPICVANDIDLSQGVSDPQADIPITLYDAQDLVDTLNDVSLAAPLLNHKPTGISLVHTSDQLEVWLDCTTMAEDSKVLPRNSTVLFGFGCGSWAFNATTGIKFEVKSDVQPVTLIGADGTKTTNMICAIIHEISTKSGKHVKLAYHDKEQLKDAGGVPLQNRMAFTVRKDVRFKASPLDVESRTAEGKPIMINEFGAAFAGKEQQLPSKYCEVTFDMESVPSATDPTSVTLRPIAPKLVLSHSITAIKGKFVRLL